MSLGQVHKIEITECLFSDHNGIKAEIGREGKSETHTHVKIQLKTNGSKKKSQRRLGNTLRQVETKTQQMMGRSERSVQRAITAVSACAKTTRLPSQHLNFTT